MRRAGEGGEAERRRSASSDGGEVAVRAVCRAGAKNLVLWAEAQGGRAA
jgi:hypothetical protein